MVRYSFPWTTPNIFNWRFTNHPLIWLMWKLHQLLEKNWSLVECDSQSNRHLLGNDIDVPKNWKSVKHEFCTNWICYKKADICHILKLQCIARGIWKNEKILYVWFRTKKIPFVWWSLKNWKKNTIFMKLLQKTHTCALKLYLRKVLLVCVCLISTRLFLNVTAIKSLAQFLILSAFSRILMLTIPF